MEKTNLIEETDNYLYAEFKTQLMGYIDYLGVNCQRIEEIRSQL